MKVIILAGGYGSRLESITGTIPKPMVPIGSMPILWHIMKIYSHYGYDDFVIALGYKGDVVKNFFLQYQMLKNDFTINLSDSKFRFHNDASQENWSVTLADTGLDTQKSDRIKKVERYLDTDTNMLTYGDGLADIDLKSLEKFHKSHGKILTVSGVHPPSIFGEILSQDGRVTSFFEKPGASRGLVNGGFMVFDKRLLDYLKVDEDCDFESDVLPALASVDQVMVYTHSGSWMCMDSKRDLLYLNNLWKENKAFWKIWD